MGFSHQSVPSLSNTATRSSTGTGSEPSAPQTRATNSTMRRFAAPSRHPVRSPTSCADFSVSAMAGSYGVDGGAGATPGG